MAEYIVVALAGLLMLGADVVGFLDEAASIPAYGMVVAVAVLHFVG